MEGRMAAAVMGDPQIIQTRPPPPLLPTALDRSGLPAHSGRE